jgi:colanic acid biosynthesis glycosyl transferase WcaI
MRILFFTDHFKPEPSAPAAHVHERAKLWIEWGHHVTVLTSAPNFPEGIVHKGYRNRWRGVESMDGIRVVRVKTFIVPNEGFALRTLDYLSYLLSAWFFAWFEPRPDVVISTSPHLFVSLGAVLHARLRGLPHVMEIRDLWPATIAATTNLGRGRLFRVLERIELWLYRSSVRLVPMTQAFEQNLLARGVPQAKMQVVINGANLELFSPRPKDSGIEAEFDLVGKFVVGYLGTIGLAHDLQNMIQAAELLREDPRIRFFLVGAGAARAGLEASIHRLGLTNVVLAPRQIRDDMPRFWSVCDASLIHLKNDPVFATVIPSKIFESMAMGLPILYVGPPGEGAGIVAESGAGLVIPPGQPAGLAAAVRRLADQPSERMLLAAKSAAAASRFSRSRQARDTLLVLEQAAGLT